MPDADELRELITTIDAKIIDLIATRMEITDELAKAKKESSQSYWNKDKEHEVIVRYLGLCEEVKLSEREACQIADLILKISKNRQKQYFKE